MPCSNQIALLVAAAALATAIPAFAKDADDQAEGPNFAAFGAGFTPEYVGADQSRVIPFGAFKLSTPAAELRSSGLSVSADFLAPYQRGKRVRIEFGPQANYRFGRDPEDIDDAAVRALGKIDDAVEVGLVLGVTIGGVWSDRDRLAFRIEALRDASDVHDGNTFGLETTYTFPTPRRWRVDLVANTQYGDDRFHSRYFDVSPAQSQAAGLPAFDARSGFYQVAIGTNVQRYLTQRWFIAGQVVVAQLIGDVADSPVVADSGSDRQLRGGIALGVTF